MDVSKYWDLKPKHVLISYALISLISSVVEILLTGTFQWSFIITYLGVFFIGHHLRRALNDFFKQFHIKKVVRSLLTPWILFGLVFLYVQIFFFSYYLTHHEFIGFGTVASFIFFLGIIILTLISINHIIRIIAVAFHRRKSDLFPINRLEYPALKYLSQEKMMKFDELKDKIHGLMNIFIPEVYFNYETAASSIYHLCGIRLADINNDNFVSLNNRGKESVKSWNKTLQKQVKRYDKILNSKGVLIRSFIGLSILSLLKIIIGNFSSESLRAEGIENFLDCIAVLLIGIGIRYRKEKLVNIILVILMAFAGASIIFESIISLIVGPMPIKMPQFIILIALISIFLNTYLRTLKNFVGKKNRNSSLIASAIDSRVNIVISIGIILGTLLSEFGRIQGITFLFYFDPIIAIAVSIFIFKEIIEIINEFITEKEEIEFEKFQMPYEENFKEYIIKWILSVFIDNPEKRFTINELNQKFLLSLKKSEEIYTNFSYMGLYIFKENGVDSVIKSLILDHLLQEENDNKVNLTEKGKYMYENFYSEPLMEDIKDPFDFFFEQNYDFDSLRHRKELIFEKYLKIS
ncbi:MAG: cation diffusion facilitator family transporter [Candidatus Thorarchaeota archaeon]